MIESVRTGEILRPNFTISRFAPRYRETRELFIWMFSGCDDAEPFRLEYHREKHGVCLDRQRSRAGEGLAPSKP